MPRERGQIPYFKDAATPADIADGGGVTGYAATGSSPRAGGAVSSHGPLRHAPGIIPTRAGSSFPGIGYTCFGVDRIRPGIRSGYRDAGSFALDDVLPAVPVEHDDVALLDESELHRLGGLLKRRVKRNGVEAVRLPVRTAQPKTQIVWSWAMSWCDYQSERHCSKTNQIIIPWPRMCDYQSERHCSKTDVYSAEQRIKCDYQSERHCSKTDYTPVAACMSAITSQNGTAPKLVWRKLRLAVSAITSQNGTAPKRHQ